MLAFDANGVLAYKANMNAKLIIRRKVVFGDRDFAEFVVWQVPTPVPPSVHGIKYRLAYIVDGVRVIGFDNERGKGDHRHAGDVEVRYTFETVEKLVSDFNAAIKAWRTAHGKD